MEVDLELPSVPDSVGLVRDALDRLACDLAPARQADARLLVSEVVTNAVRHARAGKDAPIRLRMAAGDGRLRVEVMDRGSGFTPGPRGDDLTRPGGWGLYLVEKIASRWGVEATGGTTVWFELTTR